MEDSNNKRKKPVIPFILLVIIISGVFVWKLNKKYSKKTTIPGQSEYPQVGYLAPDFDLPDVEGKMVKLSDYKGKVVFINFWATWCASCDEEMPSMEVLHQKFKDKDFTMLTISRDKDKKLVKPYMKKFNLSFTVLLDSTNEVGRRYQTTGVPETFIIDKNGIIVHKQIGPADWTSSAIIGSFEKLTANKNVTN